MVQLIEEILELLNILPAITSEEIEVKSQIRIKLLELKKLCVKMENKNADSI